MIMIYDGEMSLEGATEKEIRILCSTKKARIKKKYFDRIARRQASRAG